MWTGTYFIIIEVILINTFIRIVDCSLSIHAENRKIERVLSIVGNDRRGDAVAEEAGICQSMGDGHNDECGDKNILRRR